MKAAIFAALISILSFNTFADCTNAYKEKAGKRARSNKVLKNVAAWTTIVGASAGVGVLIGPGVLGLTIPAGGIIGGAFTGSLDHGTLAFFGETRGNTYYKVLDAIVDAKRFNRLSPDLKKKLNKEMNLQSYSDDEIQKIQESVITFIKAENESGSLCKEEGKIRTLNFNKFVDKIIESANL